MGRCVGLLVLAALRCLVQAPGGQAQVAPSLSCVTSDGFLGDCRPPGSCAAGGWAGCAVGTVCCERVTVRPVGAAPPPLPPPGPAAGGGGGRPIGHSARPPRRRRSRLLDPPFECGGQQAGDGVRKRRAIGASTAPPPTDIFSVVGGAPEPETTAVGVGVIGTPNAAPTRRPSLNDVLGRLTAAFSGSNPSLSFGSSSGSDFGSGSGTGVGGGFSSPSFSRPPSVSPPGARPRPLGRRRPNPFFHRPPPKNYRRRNNQARRNYYHPRRNPYQVRRNPYAPRYNYYRPGRLRYPRRLYGRPRRLFRAGRRRRGRRPRRSPQQSDEPAGFADIWREYQQRVRSGAARAGVTRQQLLEAFQEAAREAAASDGGGGGGWTCGAVLIWERHMLTAAHCLQAGRPAVVRLGDRDLASDADGAPAEYRVVRVVTHPEYRQPLVYHDLAILELDRRVTFGPHVRPFCLFDGRHSLEGLEGHVSGWGATEFDGAFSDTLQGGNLTIWSRERCDRVYRALPGSEHRLPRGVTDGQLCAGGGKQDACQGDSGGPMTVLTERGTRLVGVVSSGVGCATPGVPGLYTNAARYVDWIDGVVFGR